MSSVCVVYVSVFLLCFFFQAEDGIRDWSVTGVQTCALPIFGGFLLERGNPWVLMQPAELLIICGSAIGIVLVANSPAVIRKMLRGIVLVFRPRTHDSQSFEIGRASCRERV